MYPNLLAEMARRKITAKELAEKLGVTPTTMSWKLNGKSTFTLEEASQIKVILGTDVLIEELFQSEGG